MPHRGWSRCHLAAGDKSKMFMKTLKTGLVMPSEGPPQRILREVPSKIYPQGLGKSM